MGQRNEELALNGAGHHNAEGFPMKRERDLTGIIHDTQVFFNHVVKSQSIQKFMNFSVYSLQRSFCIKWNPRHRALRYGVTSWLKISFFNTTQHFYLFFFTSEPQAKSNSRGFARWKATLGASFYWEYVFPCKCKSRNLRSQTTSLILAR